MPLISWVKKRYRIPFTIDTDEDLAHKKYVDDGLDTKANTSHTHDADAIVTGTLNAARLPAPGTTTLGGVKRNEGTAGQFVNGIDAAGDLLYATPAGGGGGGWEHVTANTLGATATEINITGLTGVFHYRLYFDLLAALSSGTPLLGTQISGASGNYFTATSGDTAAQLQVAFKTDSGNFIARAHGWIDYLICAGTNPYIGITWNYTARNNAGGWGSNISQRVSQRIGTDSITSIRVYTSVADGLASGSKVSLFKFNQQYT